MKVFYKLCSKTPTRSRDNALRSDHSAKDIESRSPQEDPKLAAYKRLIQHSGDWMKQKKRTLDRAAILRPDEVPPLKKYTLMVMPKQAGYLSSWLPIRHEMRQLIEDSQGPLVKERDWRKQWDEQSDRLKMEIATNDSKSILYDKWDLALVRRELIIFWHELDLLLHDSRFNDVLIRGANGQSLEVQRVHDAWRAIGQHIESIDIQMPGEHDHLSEYQSPKKESRLTESALSGKRITGNQCDV